MAYSGKMGAARLVEAWLPASSDADLLRLGLVDYQRRTREHLEKLDLTDCKI